LSLLLILIKKKDEQWPQLIELFPNDHVRYAVADFHFNLPEGPRTEMVFISWAPETASVKNRMLMASSKDALKNTLVGIKHSIQACSYPDMDVKAVAEKFKGTVDC
jgi:cofilin